MGAVEKFVPEVAAVAVQQPRSTMDMVQEAVMRGASLELVDKLVGLHERFEASNARRTFENAMADAKAEIPVISKNRKVDFTSPKGRTNYEYEDLGEIAETVVPIMSKYGLNHRYRSTQGKGSLTITCIVSHRDGHFEETTLEAADDNSGNKNSIQAIGSTATFLQRYTLKLALGLAASKDDDGAKAGPEPKKINEDQLQELLDLADELGADKRKFCQFYGIDSFSDILASQFDKAKQALLAKRRATA